MKAIIARVRVAPADAPAFEADFAQLAAYVHAEEPETLVYRLARLPDDPGAYEIIEIYANTEAIAAHTGSEAFQAFRPKMIAALTGAPDVSLMDVVV